MQRIFLLSFLTLVSLQLTFSQTWNVSWKMTSVPYLTKADITEMAIVKAGFDTDKDGWGEFLCAWTDLDTNAILMYEANGDNSYSLVWSWVFPVTANSFAGIAVGDLNNNGLVDIITTMPSRLDTNSNPPRLWVFEWSGVVGQNAYGVYDSIKRTYSPSTFWNFEVPNDFDLRPYSLIIDDIDKDGENELIAGIRQSSTGTLRQIIVASFGGDYLGFGSWDVEYKYSQTYGGSLYSVTIGDLDGDGNKEIYGLIWNRFTMVIIECTGNKQYTVVFKVDRLFGPTGTDYGALDGVRVADADKNGSNEMYIAGTEDPNKIFVVSGVSDVSKMDSTQIKVLYTIPVAVDGGLRAMYTADPDRDGNISLMIAGERDGRIYDFEYKGSGNPADSTSWELKTIFNIFDQGATGTLTPRLFYGHPALDMDKDGKSEYVFVNYSPDYTEWADDVPLWVIEISVASEVRDETRGVPRDFGLYQNYPNPFNPETSIPYRISTRSYVRLEVYNIYGQLVANITNGEREPGYYTARWSPNVPSGTYLCRLFVQPLDGKTSAFTDTKKMTLLK